MNIPFALMNAIKRFAARRESPRVVERTTCVFILVPLHFRGNGHAKKPELDQDLNNASELNYDLMWMWFLPNPLWLPNKSNRNLVDLFRFWQNGFNAKTGREN
jgi:hypothetical protein